MNYAVSSCTLRNLKSVGIEDDSFYDLVRSKPFTCWGFVVPSVNLKVSSIYQNSIINVEVLGFFNMKGASFVVDSVKNMVDIVLHCSNSIEPFFCSR